MNPKRYEISPAAKWIDRVMTRVIQVGGIGIIVAVFGIFVFILSQIVPLFRGARVEETGRWPVPPGDYVALGSDEWTERPFVLDRAGTFTFLDLPGGGAVETLRPAWPEDKPITALAYRAKAGHAVAGTASGEFAFVRVGYRAEFDGDRRTIEPEVEVESFYPVGQPGHPVRLIRLAAADNARMVAALQDVDGQTEIHAALLSRRRTLMGGGRLTPAGTHDLTGLVEGAPTDLLVNSRADSVMVVTDARNVHYLFLEDGAFAARQVFEPFGDAPGDSIATADFLFGDDSIVFTSAEGRNRIWSLYVPPGETRRLFGQTKDFDDLPGTAATFVPSLRNKAFLLAGDGFASVRYGTTGSVRWEGELEGGVQLAALSGKADRMLFLDGDSVLHIHRLDDPHPEAGFKAFFGKIWYEGSGAPKYEWQSTGSTDDFEAKLSMVPLLIGTLKGTLYAMIFSVPIALLAALYASQFASPALRRYVKPVMEIMASLPSVILGFLAALWLAPLLETRVPSLVLAMMFVPAAALAFGGVWGRLPYSLRRRIPEGAEVAAAIPLVLAAGWAGWSLGPWLERTWFVVTDPATGQAVADFRLWWPQATGLPFEQRNSLVVGFMMGFAVIPIIFTITEDALSNVPASFRSSSLALGASRWQTAIRVILPTASAGIFSAIMIGFGRAVGETMIVLMATGNTPIMDFNIFSGMRTLSANIAVELPEAPHHGTLYRTLFLGSMLLFMMTFCVNTLAEILRHHLREKYKAV
jgi:phosphate transport system permease protein